MAIRFQYNKTSLQLLEKQLKVRVRALPTIKSKESALRMEVKRTKDEAAMLKRRLEERVAGYEDMVALWCEFDASLLSVRDVSLNMRKIAGVQVPVLGGVEFDLRPYSLFNSPSWYADGIALLKDIATLGLEAVVALLMLVFIERARKKTTQKVNLFEKVQIPGYQEAILKIKRFMEDEESLSKSSQKIMRANIEKRMREGVSHG